ncbi:hypothetical protein J3Q64DRAFT_1825334 [Phycomyces blakesleeanus]|uniref:Uncharacterized protein n=1 Tax=Phycomyces blakesleeanus TaxID=4837 RepID=A0ABR3AKX1_PHYBL
MTNYEIVYAVHNFEAENEDEIAFGIGEPIQVLERDEKYHDGWWQAMTNVNITVTAGTMTKTTKPQFFYKGRNPNGEVGLFPMSYTSPNKPKTLHAPSSNSGVSSSSRHTSTGSNQSNKTSSAFDMDGLFEPSLPTPKIPIEQNYPPALVSSRSAPTNSNIRRPSLPDESAEDWDVEQVANWLIVVGLGMVADLFIEQEITGDILLDLTIDSLKELGITTYGKRYKVMNAINKLKNKQSIGETHESTSLNGPAMSSSTSSPSSSSLQPQPLPRTSLSTGNIPPPPPPPHSLPPSLPPAAPSAYPNNLSQSNSSESDGLYQYPRKAPLPPLAGAMGDSDSNNHRLSPLFQSGEGVRPPSFQSMNSGSNVSRTNTFNTTSSKKSSVSSGTVRSHERPLDLFGKHPASRLNSMNKARTDPFDVGVFPTPSKSTPSHGSPNTSRSFSIHSISSKHDKQADFALSVDPLVAGRPSLDGNSKVPEHEGWLYKQSDRYRTWNKRWFVLKGANLFYFKGPKDVRMKGIINLRGYRIIVDATIHAGKYSFKAQHERERTFFFYTDAKDSMRAWIQMLMKATITRDLSAPVMSSNHVSTIPLDVARRMRPRPPSVIMYKPQKPKQDAKMEMLEEEEETTLGPMAIEDDPSVGLQYRQTRESGVTVYPHHLSGGEIPEVPDLYQKYRPESKSETKQEKVAVLGDEDEDLIDPHHRQLRVSSSSDKSSSHSSFSATDFPKPWTRAQYIEWVNQHLPAGKHVVELTSAFRNGDALVLLLESLSHKVVRRAPTQKGGSVSMQMLDTIVAAFKFMGREGVVVDGRYTIKDVFGGNERKIMDMLDAIKLWAENNDFSSVATNEPAEKTPGWSESGMLDQRLATANRAEQALRRSMFEEEHEPIIF